MVTSAKTVFETGDQAISIDANIGGDAVTLPAGFQLFSARFARQGSDLRIDATDGNRVVVTDYFTRLAPPDLVTADNGVLHGDAVRLLAGAGVGAELVQAGAGAAPIPIGQVETVTGSVRAQRLDGTIDTLAVGSKIYARDVVTTDADGRVSLTFADGTIFSMSESSRMVIDELVYNPAGENNSAAFNLINGGFVFIAGQVAKTGDMTVETPAATMGIRGTNVSAQIERSEEVTRVTVALNRDPDGSIGQIQLFDLDNNLITTITATDTMWVISPSDDLVLEMPRTAEDDGDDALLIADALTAYQIAQQRVQAGQTYVEMGSGGGPGAGGRPDTGFPGPAPEQNGPNEPEDQDPDTDDTFDEGRIDLDNVRDPLRAAEAIDIEVSGPEDSGEDSPISGQIDIDTAAIVPDSFALGTAPSNGSATVLRDGTFLYVPEPDFFGTDTFSYQVTGADGTPVSGTVTVNVEPVNDPPNAAPDAFAGSEDGIISGTLLANDTDVEDDPLTVSIATSPAHGTLTIAPDGGFTYTPDADFHGTDSFVYSIDDGNGGIDSAVVTLTVAAVNDAPVATGDSVTTNEDSPVTFAVTANDADTDGDPLAVTAISRPANGSAVLNADGSITYTPDADFHGTDSFAYTVADSRGGSDTGRITVTVAAVNDAPALDAGALAAQENGPMATLDLAALGSDQDDDDDGTTLTYTVTGQPSHGTASISGTTLSFDPGADFDGMAADETRSVTIQITATDRHGATATNDITVTVQGTNQAPAARSDFAVTPQGSGVTMDVTENDTDADGDALSVIAATTPANGSVSFGDGSITYTPNTGFYGVDTLAYTVSDGHGGTDSATLTVLVEQDITQLPPDIPVSITFNPDTPGAPPGAFLLDVTPVSSAQVHLVVAMDSSGSISSSGWNDMKDSVSSALEALRDEFAGSATPVNVAFVAYSNGAETTATFDLVDDFDAMTETLDGLSFQGGGTNWEAAFDATAGLFAGAAPGDSRILYFLTDGNPYPESQDWQGALADLTAGNDVDIEAFAIGSNVNLANLNAVDSDGTATTVTDPAALENAFAQTPLFNAQLVEFSLRLTVDGVDQGVIADETSPALQTSGLDFSISLKDIPGLDALLGDVNVFAATAVFDLDGDPATTGDQIELFAGGVVEQVHVASASSAMVTDTDAPSQLALPSDDALPVPTVAAETQGTQSDGQGALSLAALFAPPSGDGDLPGLAPPPGSGGPFDPVSGGAPVSSPAMGLGLISAGILDGTGLDDSAAATLPS